MATRWHPPRIPRRHSVAPRRHFHLSRAVLEPIFRSRWYSLEASTSEVPNEGLTSLGFLMKGGFVRKSASGVYTVMPNGRRVLDKIERIVREEMRSVGAQEISLPTLQSASIWQQSGRLESTGPELFRLTDRKGSQAVLAPTHEEEITQLVASDRKVGKKLPLRLFQIGTKFRDEARPRGGLLRAKEFLMKDLYTFDARPEEAKVTYAAVRGAYDRIFTRLGVPFRSVEADSGNIGGSLSHEYQYASRNGEDTIVACSSCSYASNVELAVSHLPPPDLDSDDALTVIPFTSPATRTLIVAVLPTDRTVNLTKLRRHVADAEPVSRGQGTIELDTAWEGLKVLIDPSCTAFEQDDVNATITKLLLSLRGGGSDSVLSATPLSVWPAHPTFEIIEVRNATANDLCPSCRSPLVSERAIEVGHTFYLGTKYSSVFGAKIVDETGRPRDLEMGCYGIGISRLLGAVAECCHDKQGLQWPPEVSPFRVCFVLPEKGKERALEAALNMAAAAEKVQTPWGDLVGEVMVDDRPVQFGTKFYDAEMVGYPVVVVLGNSWQERSEVEVWHTRTRKRTHVPSTVLPGFLKELFNGPASSSESVASNSGGGTSGDASGSEQIRAG